MIYKNRIEMTIEIENTDKPSVSSSAKYIAETIQALNNTLLANKAIGNYKHIEEACILKLVMLINKIE